MGRKMAVADVLVDPRLPDGFWNTPNEERSVDQMAWWGKPFVVSTPNRYFQGGTRYDVYCLDGESWNHPTPWGMFGTIEEAIERAKEGPPWKKAVDLCKGVIV